jgi:hypothetical protein
MPSSRRMALAAALNSTMHLELLSLDVLRVLGEQTLDISKEVKDPSIPDPSLFKEVKDSSLTILLSYRLFI